MKKILWLLLFPLAFLSGCVQDNYGICILANGDVKKTAIHINQTFAAQHPEVAPLTPHITLLQDHFDKKQLLLVKKILHAYASNQHVFKIEMEPQIVLAVDNNTFWEVKHNSPSQLTLQKMNNVLDKRITGKIHPYKPHITVLYGVQNDRLNKKINLLLAKQKNLTFIAGSLGLVRIDDVGNIDKIIDYFPFKVLH